MQQDLKRALQLYREAADGGLAVGKTNIAIMYETGHGVEMDEARAAQL